MSETNKTRNGQNTEKGVRSHNTEQYQKQGTKRPLNNAVSRVTLWTSLYAKHNTKENNAKKKQIANSQLYIYLPFEKYKILPNESSR